MPERAIFLDRDNTIMDNDGYLGDPSKVKLLHGAATALSALRALGYRLIVVSNQSGVARGMFSETAVEAVNQEMCRQIKEQANAQIDASYYCPYHPEAVVADYKLDHDWRKPKPGMLLQAAADFKLDLTQCWMIGDQPRDIAAGAAAGCRTILLRDPDHPAPDSDLVGLPVSPNYIIKTLADAARIVAREGGPGRHHTSATTPAPKPADAIGVGQSAPPQPPAPAAPLHLSPPAPPATSSKIEKSLDDLVAQLRHQARLAEQPRDFSRAKFAAIIIEVFAILALIVGFHHLLTAPISFGKDGKDWYSAVTTLLRGNIWVLSAVFLQGAVLALLHISKDR